MTGPSGDQADKSCRVESLVEIFEQIENDELSASFGARDDNIAGLLEFLYRNPEAMDPLFESAQDHYRGEAIDYSRQKSDIIRLLLLNGLQAVDPEYLELLRSAAAERARRRV